MRYNKSTFPIQKLPMSKKDDPWQEACVDYVIGMGEVVSGGMTRTRFEELQTYYNLYNSIFDEKDLKAVTNPFNVEDAFPAKPHDFNIVRNRIDLLIGEETKRPLNFVVTRTDDDAASDVQDKTKQMIINYVMATITANMDPKQAATYQQRIQSGEIMPPAQIADYMQRSYKDIVENVGYHTLNYLRQKLNIDHEYIKGWKDALIAGEEVYYVGILNGEPTMERVNPLYFSFDRSPELEFIEDGDWCCRRMRLAYTEVYDRFYDKMDEKQLNQLLELINQSPQATYSGDKNMIDDFNHIKMRIVDNPTYDFRARNTVNVWHVCWRSFKKIAYVTYRDETGQLQQTIVDENYTPNGTEVKVKWDWIEEIWEGYRVGHELYIGCKPLEYQHISLDNPNSQKLPYCGVVYSNTNSAPRSLVSILKPLQYMYIVLWYRLELALARDKGKIITMDITQIPKSMGVDAAHWMHYLSALGVNFVNPYEEGWDIPGKEGGKPSSFNQISAMDTTMSNVIAQYIQLMEKVEQMASDLSGISDQRMGQITPSELVGNTQQAIVSSSNVTEPLFWMHNQCKRNTLNMLLDTAKGAWAKSGKKKLQYIFDDVERAFIDIVPEFYYSDMDVFVTDTTKDLQRMDQLKQLIQPAMQNGATLLDAAEILTTDNIQNIKDKLRKIVDQQQQVQQQQAQQEAEQQQQLAKIQNEAKAQELMMKEAELDVQRYKVDQDNQTKITIAEMETYNRQQDLDQNNNGIPDPMEIANNALQREKIQSDKFNKQYEVDQKMSIENKKLDVEKQKITAAASLQQQKDDAAMQREQLKAKVAMANPVVGEAKQTSSKKK